MAKKTKYSDAGKGDKNRVSDKKKFDNNYEKIFEPKPWPIPLKVVKLRKFVDETKKKKAKKITDS
jgi:hypothetical protein